MLLTVIGWVLFRADSLKDAFLIMKGMAGLFGFIPKQFTGILLKAGFNTIYVVSLLTGIFFSIPHPEMYRKAVSLGRGIPLKTSLVLLLLLDYVTLASGAYNPFIYFRF